MRDPKRTQPETPAKPIKGRMVPPPPAVATAPPPPQPGRIKVRATQLGYYGEARRRIGDVFWVEDPKHFSKTWMERIDPETPERITTGQQALRQQHDEMIAAKLQPGLQVGPDTPTGDGNPLGDD